MEGPSDVARRAEVVVRDLDVGYRPGEPVLHQVSVDIAAGETLALLGPSGCGKTTLLRAIAGLQRPSAGEIRIGDKVVDDGSTHVEPHRRQVGMVFQHGALFPHLTVAQNVAFGLRDHPNPDARAAEMLALVELESLTDRYPDSLSGGQRQRVALARALAPNPSVLLLDEPFSALDAGMRSQIRRDVKRILQQIGITTIVVTHDQDEAFVFGDRVAVMRQGEVVQVGPSTDLYDRPQDRWVAAFVGEVNVMEGLLEGAGPAARVNTGFGLLNAVVVDADSAAATNGDGPVSPSTPPVNRPVDVLVRPEQLGVTPPGAGGHGGGPGIGGVIESAEYFGHDVLYQIDTGAKPLLVRTTDSSLRPGDEVEAHFRGRHVIVWPRRG